MPDDSEISLHPNAVAAFFLRGTARFFPALIALALLTMLPMRHSAANGYMTFDHVKYDALAAVFVILLLKWVYCIFLVRSYKIEMHKDGVALKYGVLNLNNELLIFAKVQDIVISRNLLERMLGISTVTVQNAMGKPEVIPGLGVDAAEGLRETILSHIPR